MKNYNGFPNFCGKPFKPVDPFVPPAPSVLEGSSLYEAMNNLVNRVNLCIGTYNAAIADCYSTLNKLYRAGQANGSYYAPDEVCTQYKYDTESQCDYAVISKKCVDNQGEPIRPTLTLAQGLHKNEGVQENIWDKSYSKISDKITFAQNPDQNGWFGVVFKNGVILASREVANTFTVGFSKNGDMHVYSNSIPKEQYLQDEIVDSCGVMGYTIANKKNIAIDDEKQVRVQMGYNNLTKMLFFIVCNSPGMTQKEMSNIMMTYGVSNAVELTNNGNGIMLNAGAPIYYTDISKIEGNLFWNISRVKSYRNDQQYEIGRLFQIYSKQMNSLETAQKKIDSLKVALDNEIKAREEADAALQNNIVAEQTARQEADTALQNQINNHDTEIDAINGRLDIVEDDISTLTNRVSAIISGETRIPYLKALNTNGNTSAYDINMNDAYNITNLNNNISAMSNYTAIPFLALKNSIYQYMGSISRPINSPGIFFTNGLSGVIFYRHWSGDSDSLRFDLSNKRVYNNMLTFGAIDNTIGVKRYDMFYAQAFITNYKDETNPLTISNKFINIDIDANGIFSTATFNITIDGFITGENEGAFTIVQFNILNPNIYP